MSCDKIVTVNSTTGEICKSVDKTKYQIPSGTIIAYAGDTTPSGFVMCNGENGTPNLMNKCLIGNNITNLLGSSIGEDFVSLNTENIPEHYHTIGWGGLNALENTGILTPGKKFRATKKNSTSISRIGKNPGISGSKANAIDPGNDGKIQNVGLPLYTGFYGNIYGADPHENRQPFTRVNYIMKL